MKDLFVFVCMHVLPASLYVHEVCSSIAVPSPMSASALIPSLCECTVFETGFVCIDLTVLFLLPLLQNTRIKGVQHHAWHVCAHTQTHFSLRDCLM